MKKSEPKRTPRRTPRKAKPKKAKSTALLVREMVPRQIELRRHAGVDYITDPDGKSIEWHWQREDREYSKSISLVQFNKWATQDGWVPRRDQFWTDIETRTLEGLGDKILQERLRELEVMTEARSYMTEYMMPLKDSAGQVLRHPTMTKSGEVHPQAGLPVFPLELPRLDRFLKALLDLDERVMLKRGEAITRTETVGSKTKLTTTALDPVGSLVNISREEARRLAQHLLRQRMGDRYEGVLDLIEGDATDDDGAGDEEEDL